MKDDIEIGEYIRTVFGDIGKVYDKTTLLEPTTYFFLGIDNLKRSAEDYLIVKHSNKIIDLIYEGDYVNNDIVDDVKFDDLMEATRIHFKSGYFLDEQFIRRIVTKEKLEEVAYKINEENTNERNNSSK